MVTTFGRAGYLRQAMAAGASGFIVKDTPARQLADAVRRVHEGLRVVDPALAAQSLAQGDSPLTERETDVLRSARDGGTVADIARDLHLSEGTVRNHLSVGDRQDRRPYPRRGGPARRRQRLAAGLAATTAQARCVLPESLRQRFRVQPSGNRR